VLLFGGLMLLGGRLTDVLGRRRVLLTGLVLFTGGSLLAGAAPNEGQLLAARAIQGIAAAALSPAALSILVVSFPDPKERTKAFGVWGTVIGVGASLGTLLGGAIIDVGWRWAFYINVPVGVLLLAGALALIAGGAPAGPRPASDLAGALTSTAGLLALVFGIVSTTTRGWGDALTLGSFAAGAVLLTAFVRIEARTAQPLLDLGLFRRRGVVAAGLGQFVTAGIMLPSFFLLPLYMQTVLGYSPMRTGVAYIPTSLAMMVFAGVVTQLIPRTGPRVLYVFGTLLLGLTAGLMVRSRVDGGYWGLLLPVTAALGTGLLFCLLPTPVVGTAGATEEDAGTISAVLNSATQIGGAFGLAVAATVVQSRSAHLTARGVAPREALNQALHWGFAILLAWVAVSLVIGLAGFRGAEQEPPEAAGEAAGQGAAVAAAAQAG
jgi:EmrB/QacA subfamily drug resistance transporter